jgi:CheY-like chemotaxis protein
MAAGETSRRMWLLVEDDISIRMMLSTVFIAWGRTPLVFEDGHQAMAWLDRVETGTAEFPLPELALLDIRMPGPQGTEIAQRLRSLPVTANIAIVMMTAYRLDPDERAKIDGVARPEKLVSKPLPAPNELRSLLEAALEVSQHRAPVKKRGKKQKEPTELSGKHQPARNTETLRESTQSREPSMNGTVMQKS